MPASLIAAESAAAKCLEQMAQRCVAPVLDAKELGVFTELHQLGFGTRDVKLARDLVDRQFREADDVDVQFAADEPQCIDDLVITLSELDHVSADSRARVVRNEREALVRQKKRAAVLADEGHDDVERVMQALDLCPAAARIDDERNAAFRQEIESGARVREGARTSLEETGIDVRDDNDLFRHAEIPHAPI